MAEQLYRKRIAPSAASNVDELVSKNVLAQLRRDPPPRPAAVNHEHAKAPGAPSGANGPSGTGVGAAIKSGAGGAGAGAAGASGKSGGVEAGDLIASMAKRLGALERDLKERQSVLQAVQADNAALKAKLKAAEEEVAKRAVAAIEPRDDSAAVMHLRAENSRLRAQLKYAWKQVAEMKSFLNDYGMVWMGEPEAEAELAAQGYGSVASGVPSAAPNGSAGPLQSLSPEPSDVMAPRRSSHTGAAPGPSSGAVGVASGAAAAAGGSPAALAAVARGGRDGAGDPGRGHERQTGGMTPAAAAALERAGEGGAEAAAALSAAAAAAKRSGSFTAGGPPPPQPSGAAASSPSRPASSPRSALVPLSSTVAPVAPSRPRSSLPCTMAELQAKVDELNDLAGDGCGQVVRDGAGAHVIAMRDPVNLVIYKDGLQMHTLPAKPFSDPAGAAILRDILDGYFPYVLKRDFPDGVPLRVVDRTSDSIGAAALAAAARRGGGGGGIHSFGEIDAQGAEPVTREKFLSRLPQAVIKNGKAIEIRSDISRILGGPGGGGGGGGMGDGGGKADVALVSTPVDALLSTLQRNHMGPTLPPPSRDGVPPATEVTTLQVKSVDGKQTYILKLKYDDTIGSLRSCIGAHHAKSGAAGVKYEIRSAFPARAYTDDGETLQQAGLIPNATLFLRAIQ